MKEIIIKIIYYIIFFFQFLFFYEKNLSFKVNINENMKYYILDTSFFIKIRKLDLLEDNNYICTQSIINEIRDKKWKRIL